MSKFAASKIVIEVSGGLVTQVSGVDVPADIEVWVVDRDIQRDDPESPPSVSRYSADPNADAEVMPIEDGRAVLEEIGA